MDERVQVVPNTDGGATFLRKKEIDLVAKLLLDLNLYREEIPALFGENRLPFFPADERGDSVKKRNYSGPGVVFLGPYASGRASSQLFAPSTSESPSSRGA